MLSDFVKYVKQYWHDRPDKSTPLNADRLNHIENGIGSNSEAINQIANAVVSNIVNDPDKIASMAAVYTLQEKLGTGDLLSDAPNAISAINTLYSNLTTRAMYVGYYLNNQWINILLKPNQTVLLTVNAFSQSNSVSNALYLICGASVADKSGSILKVGGTFDLITNWNTGLSIGINAAVDQWLQISALYL